MMIATIPPTAGIAEGRVPLTEREIPVNIKARIHHITKNRMVFNRYLSIFIINQFFKYFF